MDSVEGTNPTLGGYQDKRKEFIETVVNESKYGKLHFSDQEDKANSIFLSKVVPSFDFPDDFYDGLAMKYKDQITKHPFFDVLYSMPKGALLHHHIVDCINIDWITNLATDNPNIYLRQFPASKYPNRLVYTKERKEGDVEITEVFADWLKEHPGDTYRDFFWKNLSMLPDELAKAKANSDAWDVFMPKYFFAYPLICYREYYKQHLESLFDDCINEKIYRLESRITLGKVTDENMNPIPLEEEMKIYSECVIEARKKDPKFSFGIIVEMIRRSTPKMVEASMEKAFQLKTGFPDLIIAMDLDGDEDVFPKFESLADTMLRSEEFKKKYGVDVPWILHCGESLRVANQNPIDGYLLGAKRFGHGINLFKHAYLLDHLKKRNVCIEINLISNQTLKNVRDLRMHPAIGYLNYGLKMTLNNDDPTLYNTKGLSYDLFIATACCEFNLLDLKVTFLNSIECSEASPDEKAAYKEKFLGEWDLFISNFLKETSEETSA